MACRITYGFSETVKAWQRSIMISNLVGNRAIIENIYPEVDCGRYPVKRTVGDRFQVWADAFIDGHDMMQAALAWQAKGSKDWQEVPMQHVENDRWTGSFVLEHNTRYAYRIHAWHDDFGSWRRDTQKKRDAGQDISLELVEGQHLIEAATKRAKTALKKQLSAVLSELSKLNHHGQADRLLSGETGALMAQIPDRSGQTSSRILEVTVDRERARYGAWYEIFPRSQGTDPNRSGTFDDCIRRLPEISDMGFHVLYLTPIHPIGQKHRKGRNNSLDAQPGDPGSPYAIGSHEGGHKAVEPQLGTLKDFRRLVKEAQNHGMEIALDFAIQCAPDHPWIKEHPEWFQFRPDGTIKYAENPPKKYQDIVNVDFQSRDAEGLWNELLSTVMFWVEQGVKIFRVDNPHTKPFAFWEWLIGNVQAQHPDVIFLSEAFTRPKIMYALAKLGFTQSYTYFTWRNTKAELIEYLTELSRDWPKDYFRPNFFPTTPDILPDFLQNAPPSAFKIRLALAALLSPSYGMYSGYELCENEPDRTKKEFNHSEKYEFKPRDWHALGNIIDFVTLLNDIRRGNPALHHLTNLRFYHASSDHILFFGKATADLSNIVFVAINLDPHHAHDATIEMPLWEFGVSEDQPYQLDDLIHGHSWYWTGKWQHLHLGPHTNPVSIFRLRRPKQ